MGSRLSACSPVGCPPSLRARSSSPRAWHPRGTSSPRPCGLHLPTSAPALDSSLRPPLPARSTGPAYLPPSPPPTVPSAFPRRSPALCGTPSRTPSSRSPGARFLAGCLLARPSAEPYGHLAAHPWQTWVRALPLVSPPSRPSFPNLSHSPLPLCTPPPALLAPAASGPPPFLQNLQGAFMLRLALPRGP